jgi:hypothetical protein
MIFDRNIFFWIPDFEGIYSINLCGDVIANERFYIDKNKISFHKSTKRLALKGVDCHGYKYISLRKGGKSKSYRLYQLLARTFIVDNRNTLLQVDHIDQNRINDDLSNLRVVHKEINANNRKYDHRSSTKIRGVTWSKPHGKWKVCVNENKKLKYLGLFLSKEEGLQMREHFQNKKFEELLSKYPPINVFSKDSRFQKIINGEISPSFVTKDDFWIDDCLEFDFYDGARQETMIAFSEALLIPNK